jgi:hypothetical protein
MRGEAMMEYLEREREKVLGSIRRRLIELKLEQERKRQELEKKAKEEAEERTRQEKEAAEAAGRPAPPPSQVTGVPKNIEGDAGIARALNAHANVLSQLQVGSSLSLTHTTPHHTTPHLTSPHHTSLDAAMVAGGS